MVGGSASVPVPIPVPAALPAAQKGPFSPRQRLAPLQGTVPGTRCHHGGSPWSPVAPRWPKKGEMGGGDRTPGWYCHCPHRVTSWCGAGEGPGAQRGPQPGLCHHPSSKPPCPQNHRLSSKPPCPQRHCLSPKPPPVPKATTMSPKPPPVPKAIACPQSHRLSPKPSPVPKATMSP